MTAFRWELLPGAGNGAQTRVWSQVASPGMGQRSRAALGSPTEASPWSSPQSQLSLGLKISAEEGTTWEKSPM